MLHFSSLIFLFFLFFLSPSSSLEPRSPEVIALMAVREGLEDPRGVLKSWDEYSVDPCSFAMVTCSSDNLVVGLGIPSQSISGTLVSAIANLSNLRQVQLQDNNISGRIPPEIGGLSKLQTLDLANNLFSGRIPESMGDLRSISYLRMNNNTLSGDIPLSLAMSPLLALVDLSYNNLSGRMPGFSETTSVSVVGNPLICGRKDAAESRGCGFSTSSTPTAPPSPGGVLLKRIAVVVGISLGTVVIVITFIFTLVLWRRRQLYTHACISINDKDESEGLGGMGNLRSFTLRELQVSTDGFTAKNILGSGGFGNVYKGKLADGSVVAVKRLKDMGGTSGESQFRTELDIISLAVHRNLLPLVGYCATPTERLLVYPYMVNGSLASRLKGKPSLEWSRRKKIAIGAARGLVYLHEQCDPKIIHRDVKAANVLLDDSYEAVVGDFGLAKLMDHSESHVTTAVRGTVGHIAPEYLSTGQSSEKTDVFGFGILLLELISGMRGVELGRTGGRKTAVLQWVRKMKEEKAEMVADSEMDGEYDRGEVKEMMKVAMACTENLPGKRPRMAEVVKMLEGGGEGMVEMWPEEGPDVRDWNRESGRWKEESSGCVLGRMAAAEDEEDDEHSLDAFAMELSGPR